MVAAFVAVTRKMMFVWDFGPLNENIKRVVNNAAVSGFSAATQSAVLGGTFATFVVIIDMTYSKPNALKAAKFVAATLFTVWQPNSA